MAEGLFFVRRTERSERELLDGELDLWLGADRIAWGPREYRTGFLALWSKTGLHLRFDARDPSPWHTMTRRDNPLWEEEVVEIFLDLDGSGTHYAEIELNPANVVVDVRMVQGSPDKKMDLEWNLEGIESSVVARDFGWTGRLFLPWDGFRSLPSSARGSFPPSPGDRWRFNVYRIERPGGPEAPRRDVVFAAYSPTGDPSFHVPASFQGFVFA